MGQVKMRTLNWLNFEYNLSFNVSDTKIFRKIINLLKNLRE